MTTRPESIWERLAPRHRQWLVRAMWAVTLAGLVAGVAEQLGLIGPMLDRSFFEYVVLFSAGHACLFVVLLRFRLMAFPVQLRIAYLIWVAAGTYLPSMVVLMYISTVGVAASLVFDYCPLARIVSLLRWNREEPLSLQLAARTFLTGPVSGRFRPPPPARQDLRPL
jgi:hypothetical protein